jgi:hypothetical protein
VAAPTAPEHLAPEEVYPVAWAREGGTAVAVRPGHTRAGEVLWFEGSRTSAHAGFDEFFDAVAGRLLAVCGPLTGGTNAGKIGGDDVATRALTLRHMSPVPCNAMLPR